MFSVLGSPFSILHSLFWLALRRPDRREMLAKKPTP